MTIIRGGPAGPHTEDTEGYKNLVEDDRAMLWTAMGGVQGILRGFDHSLVSGQLQHEFTAGQALVEERDASGNLGLGRGYHLYEDTTFQVTHDVPDASSRSDAVVFAFVDIEDGAIGAEVAQSGPQVVVVKGTSGVTTPHSDADITTALGRGGWVRFADVVIDNGDTEVNPANVTINLAVYATGLLKAWMSSTEGRAAGGGESPLDFDQVEEQIGGVDHNTDSFELRPGLWFISAAASADGGDSADNWSINLYRNTTLEATMWTPCTGNASDSGATVATIVRVVEGDVWEVTARNNSSSSSLTVRASNQHTRLSARFLGLDP